MEDSRELRNTISMMDPNATVKLKLLRNGNPTDVTVKLGELPTDKEQAKTEEGSSDKALDGVTVENLDAQSARQLGLPASTTGVVVTDISPSSPLASAGLRRGDVIQEVNHQPVKNVAQLEEAIRKAGKNPLLLVNRQRLDALPGRVITAATQPSVPSRWWVKSPATNRRGAFALSSAGFSLWGLVLARTKPHRLKPALLKTATAN